VSKLTLSVDGAVATRAKRYAQKRGTSVSRLVETYLDALSREPAGPGSELPPSLRRLRGILKGVKFDREEYIDHLERKYR
jgi:hypothetical protein